MNMSFPDERWETLKNVYNRWWADDLDRPVVNMTLTGADAGRPEPALPDHDFAAFYDLDIPASDIVDRWDYNLSRCRYPGDAFPSVRCNFGPGVLAAFIGAQLIPDGANTATVWFQPRETKELEEIEFVYDTDNPWLGRIRDLYRAGLDRWGGRVLMGMTDLGGALDVLSSFRPGEQLLLDLYDKPETVKRLTREVHELWWRCHDEINSILQPLNPGYTCWAPIFSEVPYYMFQCDFAYMIGPDMFDEFVKPELEASCRRSPNGFYHLDGVGQLAHLDSLLSIRELKGVQWVPGAGQPGWEHWPEVYRKIRNAGKLIQVYGDFNTLDALAEQLGSAKGICLIGGADVSREQDIMRGLHKYGAAASG